MTRKLLTDGQARRIASEWHGGQSSPLYSFCSTGAIVDIERLRDEISHNVQTLDVGIVRRDLLALDKYVINKGSRGKVNGWANVWDESPTELDQC